MSVAASAAGEQYIVPDEENGRIPVLQVELAAIQMSLHEMVITLKEHCKQDEQTRVTVALIEREQSKHCKDLDALGAMVRTRASQEDVDEVRAMIKNPWAIGLGSGVTAGGVLALILEILKAWRP